MKEAVVLLMAVILPAVVAGQELNVPALTDFGDGERQELASRLRAIVIPHVEFRKTPIEDAVEFLRLKATDVEIESPPRDINIVLRTPPGWGAGAVSLDDEKAFSFSRETGSPLINLKLSHVPLGEALRHVAEAAGLEVRIEGLVVVLAPPAEDVESLIPSLVAAVQQLAEGGEGAMPPTLYESLRSEARVLEAQDDRLRGQGVAEEDARRKALTATLAVTLEKIEEARALLEEFLRKETALAEAWVEAVEVEAMEAMEGK